MTRRANIRGAALVEFTISMPLLTVVFLAGVFCYELMQLKLKLQEASRFAAWEPVSFALNDFGGANHASAFASVSRQVRADAERRFVGLRSVDQDRGAWLTASLSGVRIDLGNETVAETGGQRNNFSTGGNNRFLGPLTQALNQPVNEILDRWGFDRTGKITAQASATVTTGIVPVAWLAPSSDIRLKSVSTLIATAWSLGDGADAMMRNKRAGNHRTGSLPHGLYRQVERMTLFGLRNALEDLGPMRELFQRAGPVLPNPLGTFIVSHNFAPGNIRDCNQNAGYTAKAGLNNSNGQERHRGEYTCLDFKLPKCFDTAPYQDTHAYRESLYKEIFDNRGRFFLGTVSPMTENPSFNR